MRHDDKDTNRLRRGRRQDCRNLQASEQPQNKTGSNKENGQIF